MADELPAAWAELMGRHEWEWFVTLTFRESKHPEAADKCWRYWVRCLDRSLLGPRALRDHPERGTVWVRGLEWQRRDVVHFHALMQWEGGLDTKAGRFDWMREWERIGGGMARIFPVRSQVEAARYVSKYVTKGGEVDLSPSYHRTRQQCGMELARAAPDARRKAPALAESGTCTGRAFA